KLRQFDPGKTADRMLERGRIGRTELERFAEELARFHLDSAESEGRAPGRLAIENLDELEAALDAAGIQESLADLRRFTRQAADALEPAMAARQARGAVRELHGDLHL